MTKPKKYATFLLGLAIVLASIAAAHAVNDGCAVVRSTPDGFLNLREFPLGNAKVVGKLRPGDFLFVSDQSCERKGSIEVCRHDTSWTRVDDGQRGRVYLKKRGWVASRFIKGVDCEEVPDPEQQFPKEYVGEWCRVFGSLDMPDGQLEFKRQRRGKACASGRQLVITPREMRGIFGAGVAGQETKSVKAELLSCNVTQATENKNGMLWSWFICNGKPDMRNVLLLENGKLYLGNTMLEDKQ